MARIKIKQIDNTPAAAGDVITYNGTKNVWTAGGFGSVAAYADVIEFGDDDDVKDKFIDNAANDHKSLDSAPIALGAGEVIHVTISTEKNPTDSTIIQIITNAVKGGSGMYAGGTQIGADLETNNTTLDQTFVNLNGYNFNVGDRIQIYLKKGTFGGGKAEEPVVRVFVRYN